MTDWMLRAAEILSGPQEAAPKTPKSWVMGVSGADLPPDVDRETLVADLLDAAGRACDHWGDSPAARTHMEADCLSKPPHQQLDLLAHFRSAYPRAST